jgi:hypothetical protein
VTSTLSFSRLNPSSCRIPYLVGREWKRVEESGREWKRVKDKLKRVGERGSYVEGSCRERKRVNVSEREWKRVEESGRECAEEEGTDGQQLS